MIRIKTRIARERENAVSPVVGVMLMLVITIIIAAVVSGFAGGLMGTGSNQKTPSLAMDVKITNTGNASTSGFSATVLSISDPTPSKNLKITTSWVSIMGDNSTLPGSRYATIPNGKGVVGGGNTSSDLYGPYGFGPGVSGIGNVTSPYNPNQRYNNFTVTQGTGLVAEPASAYASYSGDIANSPAKALLGTQWELLQPGDTVTVRVIYIPTGKSVFQKDVTVSGA